jgi:uncharacterized protein YecE (DUF72 family)
VQKTWTSTLSGFAAWITASDRYAGWIGQIYSAARFGGRITRRAKTVGGKRFVEGVLPVECVEEYFEHFRVLELDYTFYRPLLDADGEPTTNYRALRTHGQHLHPGDRVILKVPQAVFARKIRSGRSFAPNPSYLDAGVFERQFYRPAVELLGTALAGMIFEQEYQRKAERQVPELLAGELDRFFDEAPQDPRYHMELRTDAYLTDAVFAVLERHGVGQVLSHWTWLPPLRRQFQVSGERFLNAGGQGVVRLMTPRGVRYEQAYAMAHPFDRLVEGMLSPSMVRDAVHLMQVAVDRRVDLNVIVNNRAGGNAPLIARTLSQEFLGA